MRGTPQSRARRQRGARACVSSRGLPETAYFAAGESASFSRGVSIHHYIMSSAFAQQYAHAQTWANLGGHESFGKQAAKTYQFDAITATESPPSSMAMLPKLRRQSTAPPPRSFLSLLFGQGGPSRARLLRP